MKLRAKNFVLEVGYVFQVGEKMHAAVYNLTVMNKDVGLMHLAF